MEPQAERCQATQGEPALERVAGLAEGRGEGPRLLDQARGPDQRPERQVAVAADHLGHRVYDQTGAMLDRTADQRGKRVVDDQRNTGFRATGAIEPRSATRSKGFEIVSAKISRVAGLHQRLECSRARRGVEHVVLDAPARQQPGRQGGRLSVDPIGDQRMIVLAQQSDRKTEAIAPIPEAQTKPASPPSRRAELIGKLGRVGMAVASVDESAGTRRY